MAKGRYHDWITDDGLLRLEAWARDGLTDEQIANNIGIRRETLYDWKKKYPNISNSLKRGKEVVDIEIENAMVKRALGYEYEETKTYISESDGKKIKRVEKTIKQVAPDTTAQIFWLKNRKPDTWRDKQNIEHSGQIESKASELTDEELAEEIKKLEKKLGLDVDD